MKVCHDVPNLDPQEDLATLERQDLGKRRVLDERCPQRENVSRPQRDGAAPGDTAGRVREPDEALPLLILEQLHERREAPVTCLLPERQLLDDLRSAPRCRYLPRLRHDRHATAARVPHG